MDEEIVGALLMLLGAACLVAAGFLASPTAGLLAIGIVLFVAGAALLNV